MDTPNQDNIKDLPKGAFRLPKRERLHHRSLVNHLFAQGEAIYVYPLRVVYALIDEKQKRGMFRMECHEDIDEVQFMITVPKKKQRRAVHRVLVRRRIREVYRLNRQSLRSVVKAMGGKYLSMAFIYQSDKIYEYRELEERMKKLLHKVEERLTNESVDETHSQE